jgi:hypothetical protein
VSSWGAVLAQADTKIVAAASDVTRIRGALAFALIVTSAT